MTLLFPAELPAPLVRGYTETPRDLSLSSSVDVGQAKKRRISTLLPIDVSMMFRLTSHEYDVLNAFYIYATLGGVLPFYFTHPRGQVPIIARFTGRPTLASINGSQYDIAVAMEFSA